MNEVDNVIEGEVISSSPVVVEDVSTATPSMLPEGFNSTHERMLRLFEASKAGHRPGETHTLKDNTEYVVHASGAWLRTQPRKSRKAAHRKEVKQRLTV